MAGFDVRGQITNVAGGTYVVQVNLFDSNTGALVSQAVSAPIVAPDSEPLTPQVQVPIVQLQGGRPGKVPGAGGGGGGTKGF